MQVLDNHPLRFNEVVIGALDEVYGALELDGFQSGNLLAQQEGLQSYVAQVRHIRGAASQVGLRGLHCACAFIERNVMHWQQQERCLLPAEFNLLSEVPELLAQYALNQGGRRVECLLAHLQNTAWPLPLPLDTLEQLRQLLNADPAEMLATEACCCPVLPASLAESDLAFEPADAAKLPPVAERGQSDPRAALHDALDALIVTIGEENALGSRAAEADENDAAALVRYATKLQTLSGCAAEAGAAALAKACDVFASVVIQRAAQRASVTEAERGLLNLFPILTMDSIADPENPATGNALMDLAYDPAWECANLVNPSETEALPVTPGSESVLPDASTASALPIEGELLRILPENRVQQISRQMLALLGREIGMLGEVLLQDLQAVCVPDLDTAARQEAMNNYLEALARVGATAESVGLHALQSLFLQLLEILRMQASGFDAAQQQVLQQLPLALLEYLSDPQQEAQCMPLLMLLLDPAWGVRLDDFPLETWMAAMAAVELLADEPEGEARPQQARSEDVQLSLPQDLNPELLEGLLQELPLQVGNFTSSIARLVAGQGSLADVDLAKRAAHTLKGAANTVGVVGIASLTHYLEEILQTLSDEGELPQAALAAMLTDAGDCLEAMGEAVLGNTEGPQQALQVLQTVLDYLNQGEAALQAYRAATPTVPQTVQQIMPAAPANGETAAATDANADASQMLRVAAPVVDELLRLAGENIISNSQLQERLRQSQKQAKAIQKQDALLQKLVAELENLVDVRGLGSPHRASKMDGEFDPLEFERYSELHTITSQLLEASTDARQMSSLMDEQLHNLDELLQVQRRLQLENQHALIRTRLVPVSSIVARLQRAVRQACRVLGKQVNLQVLGENTSIDSNMLHELIDPLMHMLRNAVDHGIESAEVRATHGKPSVGNIKLSFAREGNAVLVRCEDDGAGLDLAAILRSAQRKGLLVENRALSEDELTRLILLPGFSTRESASQISGRGIGMDAVHSKILEMKGALNLHSVAGQGMTVELRLPVSLLSEHTLMARIDGKLLAISSRRILDLHYITPDQIDMLGNQQVYRVGDVLHKVRRLDQLLGLPQGAHDLPENGFPALLTATDSGDTCAVLVQELLDGREAVVKKLGPYVPKIAGTIGAVILGDGSVAPVLDLLELLRAAHPARQIILNKHSQAELGPRTMRTALVIDDSLSARRATAQTMRDAGFEVRTAIDGMDAVALLEQEVPDVILVDMEMPRMNGLELTNHVRARERTKHVPIIMITSRSTEKHRQQGDAAGVNAYLLKPFVEDVLLEHVNRLLEV